MASFKYSRAFLLTAYQQPETFVICQEVVIWSLPRQYFSINCCVILDLYKKVLCLSGSLLGDVRCSSKTWQVEWGRRPCASCRESKHSVSGESPPLLFPWDFKGRLCSGIYLVYGNLSDVLHLLCSKGCGAPFWWLAACRKQQACLSSSALIFVAWYLNEAFLVPSKLSDLFGFQLQTVLLLLPPGYSDPHFHASTAEATKKCNSYVKIK